MPVPAIYFYLLLYSYSFKRILELTIIRIQAIVLFQGLYENWVDCIYDNSEPSSDLLKIFIKFMLSNTFRTKIGHLG